MFAVISRSNAPQSGAAARTGDAAGKMADDGPPLQRSRGALDLIFSCRDGRSYAARCFQQGALKVRFPNVAQGGSPEAVIVNTAGGLAGGDRLDFRFRFGAGAAAIVASQAYEKVYRALGEAAKVSVRISLEAGAALDWLPQPTIFFDNAGLHRETRVTMAADASLLAVEGVIFGRAAMGETVKTGHLGDSWFIERAGRIVHVDRFDAGSGTGPEIGAMLARATILNGHCAMATIRYVAPDAEARLGDMRALLGDAACPAAASAWDGLLVARLAAADGYSLNRELMRVLGGFRRASMPRVWSI